MKYLLIILLVCSYLSSGRCIANDKLLHFNQLPVKNGVNSYAVNCIVQDENYNYWIGTPHGLKHFDGVRYYDIPYVKNNSDIQLSVNRLLVVDSIIWIGTPNGLYKLNTANHRIRQITEIPDHYIYDIQSDGFKHIYIACMRDSKVILNNGNTTNHKPKIIDLSELVNAKRKGTKRALLSITTDKNRIFACSFKKMIQFESFPDTIKVSIIKTLRYPFHRYNILKYHDKSLYLLGYRKLERYSVENFDLFDSIDLQIVSNRRVKLANDFLIDKANTIWISNEKGIFQISDAFLPTQSSQWVTSNKFNHRNASTGSCTQFYEDKNNNIWIGTKSMGIHWLNLDTPEFEYISIDPMEPDVAETEMTVNNITKDEYGYLWIATHSSGVYRLDPSTQEYTHFNDHNKNNRLRSNVILSIYNDNEGHVWVSTQVGVNLINTKTLKVSKPKYLPRQRIYEFEKDFLGRIWAVNNGVHVFDKKKRKVKYLNPFMDNYPLHSNKITSVIKGQSNYMFLSSFNGVMRVQLNENGDVNEVISIKSIKDNSNGLTGKVVWHMVVPNDSTIYAAVHGSCLNKITIKKDKTWEIEKLLPDLSQICNLVLDKNKNIWIVNKGVHYLNTTNNHLKSYYIDDGLPNDNFIGRAKFIDKNRDVYLGTNAGIVKFSPKVLQHKKTTPYIYLSKLIIDNQIVMPGKEVNGQVILSENLNHSKSFQLKHDQNNIGFYLGTTHLYNPNESRFEFRIIRKNAQNIPWSKTSLKETSTLYFNNLHPGKYTVEVRGFNHSKVSSQTFMIKKPIWLSTGFVLAYIVVVITILTIIFLSVKQSIIYRNRLNINDKLHEIKLQLFTSITHELRSPLSLIMLPLENLMNQANGESMQRKLQIIYMQTQKLFKIMTGMLEFKNEDPNDIVTSIKNENIAELIKERIDIISDFAKKQQIEVITSYPPVTVNAFTDKKIMQRIITTILQHIILHSPGKSKLYISFYNHANFKPHYKLVKQCNHAENKFDYHVTIRTEKMSINSKYFNKIGSRRLFSGNNSFNGPGNNYPYISLLAKKLESTICLSSCENSGMEYAILFKRKPSTHVAYADNSSNSILKPTVPGIPTSIKKSPTLLPNKSILLAEDNVETQVLLKEILSEYGSVHIVKNGKEALYYASKNVPDLLITDWMMPEMNGLQLTKALRKNKDTSHIPIIVVTAKNLQKDISEIINFGADYCISKPFNIEYIQSLVPTIFQNRQTLIDKISEPMRRMNL
ncbi:MAG: response regulator [Bacteroidales bacterium]|nr:response regulator [Bacteroidales bacterium]